MHPMWDEQVAPRLSQIATGSITLTRNIKTMGLSEAAVDEKLAAYFGQENLYLGIYAKADGIHLRMIARARDTATAQTLIQPVEEAIMGQLAPYVWGYDEETPAQAVGRGLVGRGATLRPWKVGPGDIWPILLRTWRTVRRISKAGSWWRVRRWRSPMGSPQTSYTSTGR
jgi:hypothetical protein